MSDSKYNQAMTKFVIYRPIWLSGMVIGVMLLAAIGLLVNTAWRSLQRLEPIHHHLAHLSRLQQAGLHLQRILVESLNTGKPVALDQISKLRNDLTGLIKLDGYLVPDTGQRLQQLNNKIVKDNYSRDTLIAILSGFREILSAETNAHDELLKAVGRDNRIELQISTVMGITIPLIALLLIFFLRQRILQPLNNLGNFMNLLGKQDYRSVPTVGVDPLLQTLFENYNQMVNRLAELEAEHQARQKSLEQEVRAATETLLEQQRTLARAERLSAVGEVAAGLAHELRNPLAGLQIALDNLRNDLNDEEQKERLDLMLGELRRVTRLLNDLLNQSKQAPERSKTVELAATIRELLALLRYQVPEHVCLVQNIPDELRCRLPESNLRQALLNLILNSAQAFKDKQGTIEVKAAREKNVLSISVCDDGPGFPKDLLAGGVRSFATWREDGTGLGLSMVRRFAKDLGGELLIVNRDSKGACVSLELPFKE